MPTNLEQAEFQLKQIGDPSLALAALEKISTDRKATSFVKYWVPFTHEVDALKGFTADKKIYIIRGGNRSGKTEVGSFITTAFALGKSYFRNEPAWEFVDSLPIPEGRPRNIWIVGLDFNVIRDVIWREKLIGGKEHPGFIPKDSTVINIRNDDKQIFFSDGTVITCKSADSGREKFQSASVDLIWIDEECDAEIFDECYQRTVDCGGKILVTVTPLTDISSGIRHPWLFDLYEEMQSGRKDIGFAALSVLDNPAVPEEEKTRLIQKWSGHAEERARLYGEFVRRSGLVYPAWSKKIHIVKPGPVKEHWMKVVCIDPANTGTTAALWAAVDDTNNNLHFYKEYYDSDKVVSDHAKNIKIRNVGDSIDIWLIDPKWGSQRNGETHKTGMQLYRESGIPVRLAEVGEDYGLAASMEYIQATTEPESRKPKLFVHANLAHFIDEIEHYVWDFYQRGILKGKAKERPVKHNDHLMNCFQYIAALRPKMRMRSGGSTPTPEERARTAANSSYF